MASNVSSAQYNGGFLPDIMYVCICMVITYYSKGKVAKTARSSQLNRENAFSLSPLAAGVNLVSRDGFGSPVPRQSVHLHTQAESGACCCCCCFLTLTDPLRIQPWSQDRRNQTKSNRESEMSMESIQKRTGKK